MQHFGRVRPGTTLYVYFDTFDGGTGASITMSGLAVTDIEIYKDGSVTQRASDTGYTLLDTDGIDFDGLTGIHGFSIDLASNADANFFEAGSHYVVVVSAITVDGQTVSFVAADFTIGYEGAVLDTTIATLASQTSFTLEEGPAEDDALNGCVVLIHDLASAVQLGFAVVQDYTGASKTVTLTAGVTFTAAAGDNVSFFPPANTHWADTVRWNNGALTAAAIAADAITAAKIANGAIDAATFAAGAIDAAAIATDAIGAAELADGAITAATFAAGAIDATAIATGAIDADAIAADAIGSSELAATAAAEIADAVWDELLADHTTIATYGQAMRGLAARTGEVNDAGATTTAFIVDGFTEATDDHFNGMVMVFTSGANAGEARKITDYAGGTQTVTFGQAWTDAPADNDDFIIVPAGEFYGGTLAQIARLFVTLLSASGEIQANTLAADTITAAKIAADAIGASEIADGAIDAGALAADAITAAKIATGAIDADALAADAVTEIWAKAMQDLGAVPAATASVLDAINWLFEAARNRVTQTAATTTLFKDDATTTLATSTVSDNGTTFDRGEFA